MRKEDRAHIRSSIKDLLVVVLGMAVVVAIFWIVGDTRDRVFATVIALATIIMLCPPIASFWEWYQESQGKKDPDETKHAN